MKGIGKRNPGSPPRAVARSTRAKAARRLHSLPVRLLLGLLKWGILLALVGGLVGGGIGALVLWRYSSDPRLPRIYALKDYHPKQTIRVVGSNDELIGEIYEERRTYVPMERIAPILQNAIIDAEDAEFRSHRGLDFAGMLRALWVNVRSGETRQGASTITQQVVKTFLLSPERTFKRKLQEIVLARRLENALTKDEILTLYLNQIYFGHGRYGVEEAARFFFGKSAIDLGAGEAAMIAGLPQAPERLSPLKHPEAAKARQLYVLEQMVKQKHLDADEAKKIAEAPIRIVKASETAPGSAPEIVEIVRRELLSKYGADALPTLGLSVKTTINPELQAAARKALEDGLHEIDSRHGYHKASVNLSPAEAKQRIKHLARKLPSGGPKVGEIYQGVVTGIAGRELLVDLGNWQGAAPLSGPADSRFNPENKQPSDRFRAGAVVHVRLAPELGHPEASQASAALALELGPQAALVAIDPTNRHVLALVGGHGFQVGQFDRALHARRQPGSAFKPFVYAAALATGKFTAATIVNDAPEVYDLWKPKNYQREFRGPVRLREALADSINTV
ncbi:MAG: transglycosylase domain-containing protein, partial [Pseudomonadota bacterium]